MNSFNNYRSMQGIGAIRHRLGLSQQIFAMELGISRSLLSKVENKTRSLPTAALVRLAALEISMAATNTLQQTMQPLPLETEDKFLYDHSPGMLEIKKISCMAEADRLQVKLCGMEQRYLHLRHGVEQLDKMIEDNKQNHSENYFPGMLETHRYSILRRLHKCSIPAQTALRHKIALLRSAASLHDVSLRSLQQGVISKAFKEL